MATSAIIIVRTNILSTGNTILDQESEGLRYGGGNVLRGGVDFFLPNQNTLSFSSTYSDRARNSDETNIYKLSAEDGALLEDYQRVSTELGDRKSTDITASWEKRYRQDEHTLSASANISFSDN